MRLSFLAAVMATAALGAPAPVPDPLVGLAHAAPPEFASDALLRIAEKATLTQDAKIELLEEAFRLAQSAHFSIPYRSFRAESDSLAATRNQAYRLHLDALSLQTRAVRALLPLAPAKARQYFEQIRLPQFPALTCADALIPDVASFYDVLGQVAQTTFSPKERAKEEHVNFLLSYIARLTSPVQLAPAARLVRTVALTPPQKDVVLVQFTGILQSMESPGRLFEATLADLQASLSDEMRPAFADYDKRARTTNLACKNADIETQPLWQSSDSKAMFEQTRNRQPDLLQQVSSWNGSFEEKCLIYRALLDSAAGPDFDKTLAAFLGYLNSSNMYQQSPVEWFIPAQALHDRLHDSNSAQAERILAAYRESGNPILALFAALEEKYGSKRPSWIGSTG
jgi:hypothetical protein